jgi:hypothetical protein
MEGRPAPTLNKPNIKYDCPALAATVCENAE